jgi:aryl-alcohol dehydrogenase-like predicted oxidoreductase
MIEGVYARASVGREVVDSRRRDRRDAMQTRTLGENEISVVGYGAWEIGGDTWGANPEEDQIAAAIHAGLDAGINWIDTAEVYGGGRSEEILGRVLKGRDDVLVFTKVGAAPNGTGYDPSSVRKAAEKSLERLRRETIDLYQIHWFSNSVPLEETWQAMADLVDDGLARSIGVSNFNIEQLGRCETIRHVDSLQPQLSMLDRRPVPELVPWCAEHGTAVLAYGSLAYGLLSGTISADTTFPDDDWRSGNTKMSYYERLFKPGVREKHLEKVEAMRPIAERKGITPAQLALAWVFHQPGNVAAIAGSRNADHVVANARAGNMELTEQDIAEIDETLEKA